MMNFTDIVDLYNTTYQEHVFVNNTGGVSGSELPPPGDATPTQETSQSMIALNGVFFRIAITFVALATLLLVVLLMTVFLHYNKYKAHKRIERHIMTTSCNYNNPVDILTHENLLVDEIYHRPEYGSVTAATASSVDVQQQQQQQLRLPQTVVPNGVKMNTPTTPRLELMQEYDNNAVDTDCIDNQFAYVSLEV